MSQQFDPGMQKIVVPDLAAMRAQQAQQTQQVESAPSGPMDVQIRWNFTIFQERVFRGVKVGTDPRLGMLVLEPYPGSDEADGSGPGVYLISPANVLWMHVAPAGTGAFDDVE